MNVTDAVSAVLRILSERMADASRPLHGLLHPPDAGDRLHLFVFPYGILASRLAFQLDTGVALSPTDEVFAEGNWAIRQTVKRLIRTIQLLELNIDIFAEHHLDLNNQLKEMIPGVAYSMARSEQEVWFNARMDLEIGLDSLLNYAKIAADYVGKTAPSILGEPQSWAINRYSLHKVIEHAKNAPAGGRLKRAFDRDHPWFEILARRTQRGVTNAGVRNAVNHTGGTYRLMTHWPTNSGGEVGPFEIDASVVGPHGVHSENLFPDMREALIGLFDVMDRVVRIAAEDPALDASTGEYNKHGFFVVAGASNLLRSLLPDLGEFA